MSPKLALLQRQLKIQPSTAEKIPAPDTGLGAAIDAMVQQAVQQQVAEALERQQVRSPHVRRLEDALNKPTFTGYRQIPPTPKAPTAKNLSAQLHRDGAGVTRWISIGNLKFEVQRDGADRVIGMRQVDESPVLPQPNIEFNAKAREYNEGTPR